MPEMNIIRGRERRAAGRDAPRPARRRAGRGRRPVRRRVPRDQRSAGRVRRRPLHRHAARRVRHHRHRDRHGAVRPAARSPRSSSATSSIPAFDQIVNELAKFRYRSGGEYPARWSIRTPVGGGIRGGHYHSQSPEALFIHIPGLKVVCPSNPYRREGAACPRDPRRRPGAVHGAEARSIAQAAGDVPEGEYTIELGKAKVVREGRAGHGDRVERHGARPRWRRPRRAPTRGFDSR